MNGLDIYVVILFAIVSIYLFFFLYAIVKRDNSISRLFALHSIFSAVYIFGAILQLRAHSVEQIMFFQKVKYFGTPFIPLTLILLSYRFYKREYPNLFVFILLIIVPFLVFLLVTTNEYHHLYYKSVDAFVYQGYLLTDREAGLLYPIGTLYNAFSVIYSLVVYYLLLKKGPKLFRNAYIILSAGLLFLTITAAMYFLQLTPKRIDILPIGLLGLAIAYAIVIFKFDLLGSQEIYHKAVFFSLQEGILITDKNGYIIDYNNSAQKFLPWLKEENKGHSIESFEYGDLISNNNRNFSIAINVNDKTMYTDFNVNEIIRRNKIVGYAYLFVDNTEHYITMNKLRYYARHDSLTNIYNKKVIIEEATELVINAINKELTASVILIDVDNFKKINDTYGHLAGDSVLKEVAQEFLMIIEYNGVFGRYGGDEFLIVLTGLDLRKTIRVVKQLRENVINKKYEIDDDVISLTLSIGISFIDYSENQKETDLSELIKHADRALYRSKETGKNTIKVTRVNRIRYM